MENEAPGPTGRAPGRSGVRPLIPHAKGARHVEPGTVLTIISISALILTILGLSIRDWIIARRSSK